MEQVFTMLGYSNTLVSDSNTQFNDFELYLQIHNIKHELTSPYWLQANDEVERFNWTIIKTIKSTLTESREWK